MASLTERIARDLTAQYNWRRDQVEEFITGYGETGPFWKPVWEKACSLSPATLGGIAFTGKGADSTPPSQGLSLYGVHCGTWTSKYESGKLILRATAATALICKIYDILMANPKEVYVLNVRGKATQSFVIHNGDSGTQLVTIYEKSTKTDGKHFRKPLEVMTLAQALSRGLLGANECWQVSQLPLLFWMPF